MTEKRRILETHRAGYEEKVRSLRSYVKELTETAARHGTDTSLIEEDLMRARGDIEFYEAQAGHMGEMLEQEAGREAFHVYKDAAGEWRWRLVGGNRRVIAASGEGYRHRQDCLHAIELVKRAAEAPVEDEA